MPALLRNLRINTLGSVTEPACEEARVVLVKSDDDIDSQDANLGSGGDVLQKAVGLIKSVLQDAVLRKQVQDLFGITGGKERDLMLPEDIRKALPDPVKAYLEELEKKVAAAEALQKQVDDLTKKATEAENLQKQVSDLTKQVGDLTKAKAPEAEDIWKGVHPEVRKRFEEQVELTGKAQKLAEAEREQRLGKEYLEKAREFECLPMKAEELALVLKSLAEKAPEAYSKLEPVLRDASTALSKSQLFKTVGTDARGEVGSAWDKICKKADELVLKSAAKLTVEQARTQVMNADPALYAEYQKEQEQGGEPGVV